ncbi:PEPxxWA-CTERM sorting domain-containing protein [Sphingomonas sp.]|uniref:PEPxxWA-CTERM sorting domain-containing protein n=1 Tax=Sphingomonas sp. TaxID=28214 RepID=UPI003CC5BE1C
MRSLIVATVIAAAALAAAPAAAQNYAFSYSFNGTQIANGTIFTNGPGFAAGSLNVVNVTGFRNGMAITGFQDFFDVDEGDQLLFPNRSAAYVSSAGLTYQIGAFSYNITSPTAESGGGPSGLYTEYRYLTSDPFGLQSSQTVSRFTLTPLTVGAVPEPGAWAMMIVGFGVIGAGLRRRAKVRTAVAWA